METLFKLKAYGFQGNIKRQFSTEEDARHFAALMMQKFPQLLFEVHGEERIGLERRTGERRRGRERRGGFERRSADPRRDVDPTSIESNTIEVGLGIR
ncbi:MAG: hypothetical protein ABIN18_01420 [Pseudomonadota bacterium]